ncbi:hypothetical protein Q7P35_009715 [Cladosporium inversicolor]
MAPLWNCEVCCEDFHDYTSTDIDGSPVCPPCVREMFDKALKFEHEYPPKWGIPLHPSEFNHIISKDYIDTYKHKENEYKTQPGRRIYCQHMVERVVAEDSSKRITTQEPCGEFIGVRQRPGKHDTLVFGRCRVCKNATCMVCDDYSSDPTIMLQHICTGKSSANEQRAQAFVGLKRGKDWQQCPNRLCARRIELSAACNHITCTCGMGFCFICGKEADGDSEHWARKSGCPRYNHPDDDNAEYDEYDEDDDESTNSEDDGDPLENVRGLFELDEMSEEVEIPLPHMTGRPDTTFSFADFDADEQSVGYEGMAEDMSLSEAVIPPAVVALSPTGHEGQATLPSFQEQEETLREVNEEIAYSDRLLRILEELRNEMRASAARRAVPDTPEPTAITAQDAEAIANAYLEDDLSDEERIANELLGLAEDPAVTVEEADIDRALWRLHVD